MTSCGRATSNQSLFLARYINSIRAPNSLRNLSSAERKSALGETLGRGARRPRFSASSWSNASPVITGSINRSRKTCTGSETRSTVTHVARVLTARSLRVSAKLEWTRAGVGRSSALAGQWWKLLRSAVRQPLPDRATTVVGSGLVLGSSSLC